MYLMIKQNSVLLTCVFILALVLVIPVSAADSIAANTGNGQSATVGTAVTTNPSVIVKDANNIPMTGITVTFAVSSGGGLVTGASATTNAQGIATVGSWTLGTTAGTNTLTASATTPNSSVSTSITATGTAGAPTQIVVNTGAGQSATVSTAVAIPPSVKVMDVHNNPVSGVSVTFSSPASTVTGGSQATNSLGIATVGSWIMSATPGTNTLTAQSGTLTVSITATGTAASAPAISGISPPSGYNTSTLSDVTISGTGFSTSGGGVVLTKSGQTNITPVINSRTASSINCDFPLTGREAGTWTVVVTNPDGQTGTRTFTVKSQADTPTLTSIDPSSATVNTTVSITSLVGTNFASTATIKLVNAYYNDIIGTVNSVNSAGTVITGTFNLNNQVPATYDVCVINDANTYICGLSFRILSPGETATNSSIYFQSYPTGATVRWTNGTTIGTTTFTYYNITPGTYTVIVRKTGYKDYTATITALEGKRVSFYATLTPVGEDTTAATTAPTTTTKTVTTVKKSTLKVPTTWPSTEPTESPVDPVLIAAAVGIGAGLVMLKRP
jgi:hypothetical protein